MKKFLKKYLFYIIRWQLSTPILAIVLIWLADCNKWVATIVANFIGALIFFWIDRLIFKNNYLNPLWEVKENVICSDCGKECRGYRLIQTKNYDKTTDPKPQFRCEKCSSKKENARLKKIKDKK